ncbi:EamA family transporter [Streptomyces sp. NBC_00986]|uniref:EamA family transporter n=1 Tax=Streptomyces sp. NBC_00986 TaxID=2903702 RepID=UPI003862D5C0|nr:EamA family transporter [Streptomyces sp. NBC_00986]
MPTTSRPALILLTALAPVSWGTTYAVTTQFLPPDRPLFTGLMRALPAGLVLLALARVLPRGAWWWKSAVLGALNIGAFFPLLFLSAYRLPGGMAAVVGSVGPLIVVGLSAVLLGQRPTARSVLTGAVAAFGVSLVVLKAAGALDPVGVLAALASTASMSTGTVLTKRWGRPDGVGPLALTGWQLTAGGLLIAPVAFLVEGAPPALDGRAVGGYLYLALANTAIAYWLWFRGIGRLSATQVTLLGPLSPLTAAVVGWAALGQALTAVQVAGMALAFGATVFGQIGPRTPPVPVRGVASRGNTVTQRRRRSWPRSPAPVVASRSPRGRAVPAGVPCTVPPPAGRRPTGSGRAVAARSESTG